MFMPRGPRWIELGMYLIIFVVAVQQIAASESDLATTQDCYYNYNHYSEGDRILTNEPCLNCTCHNKMLMCYLKVCPFTKPIGQDCTIEKREDQCCPIITCPEVPVELDSSAAQSSSALGSHQPYGCSIDDRFYAEGAQIPGNPKKPCELCYCIRNMTSCVMQECTLHVDGCRPIYNKGVCCPVRYDCAHEFDDSLQLEDQTTTEAPSEGFVIATTSAPSSECHHNGIQYFDGELIVTDQPCEHCYCMRGDIVCAVQECVKPMELHGKNCTARVPAAGECCAKDYDCVNDEQTTTILPIELLDAAATTLTAEQADALATTTLRASSFDAIATEKVQEVATESDVAEVPTTERVDDAENEIHDKDYDHITSKPAKIDNRVESEATTALPADEQRMVTDLPVAQTQLPSEEGILANLYTTIKSIVDLTTTLGSVSETVVPAKHLSDEEQSMLANVIPGEGDCLENGVSYVNSTSVPSRSNCEISCMCLNSIVHCNKIQCLRMPPNAQNCRRIDISSQCCPRYECESLDAPVEAVPLAMDVTTEQEKSEATTFGATADEEGKLDVIGTTERVEGVTVEPTTAAPSKLHLPISSKLEDSLEHGTESLPEAVVEDETVSHDQEPVTQSSAAVTEAAAVTTEAVAVPTLATRGELATEQDPIATEQPFAVEDTTVLAVESAQDVQATTSQQEVAQEEGAVTADKSLEAITEQDQGETTTAQFVAEKQPGTIQPEVTRDEAEQKPVQVSPIDEDQKVLDSQLPEATTQAEAIESELFTVQRQQDERVAIEQATSPSEADEQPIASTEGEKEPEIVATTPQSSEEQQFATKLPSFDEPSEVPTTEKQLEQELGVATTQRLIDEQELTTSRAELPSPDEHKEESATEKRPATENIELSTDFVQPSEAIAEGTELASVGFDSERATESKESVEIATQRQSEATEQPIDSISSTEAVAADEILASDVTSTQRQSELENEIPTQRPVEIESGASALTEKPTESPIQEEAFATTLAAAADEKLVTEIPAQVLGDQSTEAQSVEAAAPSDEATTAKSVVSQDEVPEAPEWTTESSEQGIVTEKLAEIEQQPTVRADAEHEATTASRGVEEAIAATTQKAADEEVTTERRVAEEEVVATTERRPSIVVEPEATAKPLPADEEIAASTESQPSHVSAVNRIQGGEITSVSTEGFPVESEPSAAATTERQAEPIEMQTPEAVTMERDDSITESYNQERITESPAIVKMEAPLQGEESTTFGSESPVDSKEGEVTEKQIEQITEENVAAEATTKAKIGAVTSEQIVTSAIDQEKAEVTTLAAQADAITEQAVEIVTEARDESEQPVVVSEISAAGTTEVQPSEQTTQKTIDVFSATGSRLGEQSTEAEISTPAHIADEPITENAPVAATTLSRAADEATILQAHQVTTFGDVEAEIVTEQRIVEQESSTQIASEEILPSSSQSSVHEAATTERAQEIGSQAAAEGESTTSKQVEIESEISTQATDIVEPEQPTTESRVTAVAASTVRSSDEIQTERQQIAEVQPIVTDSAPQEIASEQTTLAAQTEKAAAAADEIATEAAIVPEVVPTTAALPARGSEQDLAEAGGNVAEPEMTEGFIGSKFEPIVTTQAPFSDEDGVVEDLQTTTIRAEVSAGGDQTPEELTESPIQPTEAPQVPSATQAPRDTPIVSEQNAVELSTILNRIHGQVEGESTTLDAVEEDEVLHVIAGETTQAPLEQPATTEAARDEEERGTTSAPALPAQEVVIADDNCTGTADEGAITTATATSEAGADEILSTGPVTEVNKILDLTTILSPHVFEEFGGETTTPAREEPESVPSRINAADIEEAHKQPATTEAAEATNLPTTASDETQTHGIPSGEEEPAGTQRPFILDTTTIKTLAELITTLQPIRQDIAEATTVYNRIDTDEYTSSSILTAGIENKTISSETETPAIPISPPESANNIPLIREPAPDDEIINTTTKLADNFDITTLPSILSSHTTERFTISDSITTITNKQNEIKEAETARPLMTTTTTTTVAPPAIYQPETERTPAESEYDTQKPPSSSYAASGIPSSPASTFDSGYGNVPSQYPDEEYTDEEEPAVFGPGTCRYGGKLYVSAQQIPRDDPCDFCFCFRSDIICLQQSCPPPITGCHEEPIQGFCCPRYECPVSMGLVLNATSTTTTTTLPPHLAHFARNNAKVSKRGCQIQGTSYQIGERVLAASGPCIDCICGGDGRMKCDPKACTPEPMLRQMIAVAASRR